MTDAGAVFETDHRSRATLHRHHHESAFVTIVLSGSYVEVCETVPEGCQAGMIVVHDANENHANAFTRDTRCLNVELPPRPTQYPRARIALGHTPLGKLVGRVVRSFFSRRNELLAGVQTLQAALLEPSPAQTDDRPPPWLPHVTENFQWLQPMPLRNAAAIGGVHETHFSRAFRRHIGMTPNAYRLGVRIRHASKLLLTTDASVSRIALASGFSDQSHLTRAFSQELGLAPGAYRRAFTR